MTKPRIVITDWDEMQHYGKTGKRKITDSLKWVKIHLAMRHDRRWRMMSGDAKGLYIDLILLSADAKPHGQIDILPEELAYEMRTTVGELLPVLAEVAGSGLIRAPGFHADIPLLADGKSDDSRLLAPGKPNAITEEEGEVEEEELPRSTKGWSDDVVHVDLDELALFCKDFGISHEEMNVSLKRLEATELLPIH